MAILTEYLTRIKDKDLRKNALEIKHNYIKPFCQITNDFEKENVIFTYDKFPKNIKIKKTDIIYPSSWDFLINLCLYFKINRIYHPLCKNLQYEVNLNWRKIYANATYTLTSFGNKKRLWDTKEIIPDNHFKLEEIVLIQLLNNIELTKINEVIVSERTKKPILEEGKEKNFTNFFKWIFAYEKEFKLSNLFKSYKMKYIDGAFYAESELKNNSRTNEISKLAKEFLECELKEKDHILTYGTTPILKSNEIPLYYLIEYFWINYRIGSFTLFQIIDRFERENIASIKSGKLVLNMTLNIFKRSITKDLENYIKEGEESSLKKIQMLLSNKINISCPKCSNIMVSTEKNLKCNHCSLIQKSTFKENIKLSPFQTALVLYNGRIRTKNKSGKYIFLKSKAVGKNTLDLALSNGFD